MLTMPGELQVCPESRVSPESQAQARRAGWARRLGRALRRIPRLGPPSKQQVALLSGASGSTRQQRRARAFTAAYAEANERFPSEPRKARRRIARACVRRQAKEANHA